mmetsp:Transcript_75281/g.135614  ORF Transcript_75281/g.135614 Transcript_75281/m.135614 type:complete len:398 (-) Transcript_75281:74-1267(-)
MGLIDASASAALQRVQTQDPRWRDSSGTLIRGGSLQVQAVSSTALSSFPPSKLLSQKLGGPGATSRSPAASLFLFRSVSRSKSPEREPRRPAALRDRVALTRRLSDSLKTDCLERLANVAARAPPPRHASMFDAGGGGGGGDAWEEEWPEDELDELFPDEVEEDDMQASAGEPPDASPNQQANKNNSNNNNNSKNNNNKGEPQPSQVEAGDLKTMIQENQTLANAAGLSADYSWRASAANEEAAQALAEASRTGSPSHRTRRSPGSQGVSGSTSHLYGPVDIQAAPLSSSGMVHWCSTAKAGKQFGDPKAARKQSPHRQQQVPAAQPTQDKDFLALTTGAPPMQPEAIAEARKAVAAARQTAPARSNAEVSIATAPDRGSKSLLRTSLRYVLEAGEQ